MTLITGDRVVVGDGKVNQASVLPAPGRERIGFRTRTVRGSFFVIPVDMSHLVAAGRVDRRLFDITGLIRDGYDDGSTRSIPLIVTYAGPAGRALVRNFGAETARELPSINGAAIRVSKSQSVAGLLGARAGVERVWLDGKRRISLDQSVPQIGGPAAWQAGYTGMGVTVAVLDTGIDVTHPDLSDRVAERRDFTGSGVAPRGNSTGSGVAPRGNSTDGSDGDQVGHGTHVASTVAGRGEVYRGVAPDAMLLDGKVCAGRLCDESAIIAGMQWAAVEKKADVVNLSLGGQDTPVIDPLEEAVNSLTAQTGTLFVVAAGNFGPSAGTVDSPGSADAALAVGAVDKSDEIARFTARGPRVGDGAIKPDITAPGVDIVAAKARDSVIGEPVGEHYLRLQGTSMATPHVAGAAALLAQQHPSWTAAALKSTLMSSARTHARQGVFEQGAGRVDIARAIKQTVAAETGSLSFGTAVWPHDDDVPVVKELVYRNHGAAEIRLDLRAEVAGPGGASAPAGAVRLDASSITVPAGGTAAVRVTSDSRHTGPDGQYSGRIVATGSDGMSVSTPVAVDKEIESYHLTVTLTGPDGRPAPFADASVVGLDNSVDLLLYEEDGSGKVTVRLPAARYFLEGLVLVERGSEPADLHMLVQPILRLDRDATVAIDARVTREIRTTVPRPDARLALLSIGHTLDSTGTDLLGSLHAWEGNKLFTAPLGDPVSAPEQFTAHVASTWGGPGEDGGWFSPAYTYHLLNTQTGRLYHGFDRVVKDSELATLRSQHNAQADQPAVGRRESWKILDGYLPGMGPAISPTFAYRTASVETHYVDAGPAWYGAVMDVVVEDPFFYFKTDLFSAGQTYRAGRGYTDRWGAAVLGPNFSPGVNEWPYAARTGDRMAIGLSMFGDQDGHEGLSLRDSAATRLYRNGVLIGESDYPGEVLVDDVPGERGDFRLTVSATRPTVAKFSTELDASWTFSSRTGSAEGDRLPIWAVRYFPAVDIQNTVKRQPVTVLPLKLEVESGAKPGTLTAVELRVSGDDGATWTRAAVRRTGVNRYVAVFLTPPGGFVSLSAKAADSDHNTTEQTIIRAYALR